MSFLTDPGAWWVEPFVSNPFMRNALWAGLLAAVTTSVVGAWVVLRGLSFLGDALAHGVLPGIALAFVIGVDTRIGAFVAAVLMVGGIGLIRNHSPLPDDTSIGILFVGFLALAVVIMSSQVAAYAGDLNRFLFGSITSVSSADVLRQAIAAVVVIGGIVLFYRAFLVMTFDEVQARMLGFRPKLANFGLLVLLALSIVASFETVGSLLVFGFLVAPPAAASLVVRRVPWMMVLGAAFGAVSAVVGILLSHHHRLAAGAAMALTSVIIFFLVLTIVSATHALRDRRSEPATS